MNQKWMCKEGGGLLDLAQKRFIHTPAVARQPSLPVPLLSKQRHLTWRTEKKGLCDQSIMGTNIPKLHSECPFLSGSTNGQSTRLGNAGCTSSGWQRLIQHILCPATIPLHGRKPNQSAFCSLKEQKVDYPAPYLAPEAKTSMLFRHGSAGLPVGLS